ncbi:MAG: hypothetical protein A2Y40_08335 [Candidatus Margulisbacteria bacterium GWF2_35_9]|nr:MAG: hypothetical protein A2Y40_08335 [Candidatus Margulisbacteria bacterium GWF2_35_9]
MVSPVSRYGSSFNAGWNVTSSTNGLDSLNINKFNTVHTRPQNVEQEAKGFSVQVHNVPEALQWISKKIEKKFNLKVYNSDIPFNEEELRVIYHTLSSLPMEDLKGVKSIVKNRSLQLNLEEAPSGVFAKKHKNRAYGAYDEANKRIFLFETDSPDQVATVIKHEVGHAYHSNNMSFRDFFLFALRSGWDVASHEQRYIPGNEFYNIGMVKVNLTKEEALETCSYFDWKSVKELHDKYNKYVLVPPKDKKELYAFKNPFETFAVFYEKTH